MQNYKKRFEFGPSLNCNPDIFLNYCNLEISFCYGF